MYQYHTFIPQKDISYHDLPKIESPFLSKIYLKQTLNYSKEKEKLYNMLYKISSSYYSYSDKEKKDILYNMLKSGELIFLKENPIEPLAKWDEEKKAYITTGFGIKSATDIIKNAKNKIII